MSVLTDINFLNGIFHDKVIDYTKKYYKENIFTCHNVLKNIDCNGGTLNFQGAELLRAAEHNFFSGTKHFKSALPSRGALMHCSRKVEYYGSQLAPSHVFHVPVGEGIKLEYRKTLKNLLKTHHLWEITDRPIEISGVLDGNTLITSVNCVTASIKLDDFGLLCPITGKMINVISNNVDNSVLTQSCDRCFPFKIVIGQASKDTI